MSYEYRSRQGLIRLVQVGRTWHVAVGTERNGRWASAEAAASAVRRKSSGIAVLDGAGECDVPDDLLKWTPLADNL